MSNQCTIAEREVNAVTFNLVEFEPAQGIVKSQFRHAPQINILKLRLLRKRPTERYGA